MRSKFKYIKVISAFIILAITMTSCDINDKSYLNDNLKQTYVVISQEGNSKKVTTFSLTSAEAEKMRQQDNILVVEVDGYVTGSKESSDNRHTNKKNFYEKDKHNKNMQMRSLKSSNTEWNMQTIRLDSAVLGEDSVVFPETEISTVTGSAIISVSGSAINKDPNTPMDKLILFLV